MDDEEKLGRLEMIEIKLENFKQIIKVLKQEIADLLEEKNRLLNPPEQQKTIWFKYGNQKKDSFIWWTF
jgi:hypothetical protein